MIRLRVADEDDTAFKTFVEGDSGISFGGQCWNGQKDGRKKECCEMKLHGIDLLPEWDCRSGLGAAGFFVLFRVLTEPRRCAGAEDCADGGIGRTYGLF